MKAKIICIQDSDKKFNTPIQEYLKRLDKNIEVINLKQEKNWTTDQIAHKETEKILKYTEKDNFFKILLDKEGKDITSKELAWFFEKKNKITFIIWWPYGLIKEKLQPQINLEICFWKITIPHILTKLLLLEQIYRSKTILENKNYHY